MWAKAAARAALHTQGSRRGKASSSGGGFRLAGFIVAQPVTLRLTSTRGPPDGVATRLRLTGPKRGPSVAAFLRLAALQVTQPITLRLTSTTGPPSSSVRREFRVATQAAKRAQRFIRQTEALLRRAEHEATRRVVRPTRPLHTSRAALWRWYRATGRSWAQFLADHGPG